MTDNGSKPAENLPVDTLREAIPLLRRPFTAESVRWKCQATLSNNRGLVVGYVDSRLVSERLNAVCPDLWSDNTRPLGDRIDSGLFICDLTIAGVTRSDVGQGQGKAGYSDALKRAAVRFGVAASLYSCPQQILASTEDGEMKGDKPTLRRVKKKDKVILYVTPACERWLAAAYQTWLDDHAIKVFGEPLPHGDVAESVGALLEGGAAADEPQQDDLELAAKRAEAEDLYKSLAAKQRPNLPPGRFDAKLRGSESVEQLDKLIGEVEQLKAAA